MVPSLQLDFRLKTTLLEEMGKFATVVIDPPRTLPEQDIEQNGLNQHLVYPTLSTKDIAELHLASLLADSAFLLSWAPNRFLEDAIRMLPGWGTTYTFTMVWVKSAGPQLPDAPSFNAEYVAVGRKGSPKFRDTKAFRTANCWPRGGQSARSQRGFTTCCIA